MAHAAPGVVELRTDDAGERTVHVRLTSGHAVAVIGTGLALLVATTLAQRFGMEIPLVRPVVGFLLLSFVPGFLVLRLLGASPANADELVLYAVGASLSFWMAFGGVVNFLLPTLGVPNPVAEAPIVAVTTVAIAGLAVAYYAFVDETYEAVVPTTDLFAPQWLALALVPLLAVYGGLALTVLDVNWLLLLLYAIIVAIPVLVVAGRIPERALPLVVWVVAISLLLQNTLSGNYLAWGDQAKEAFLAQIVMQNGVWDPSISAPYGNKFAMLRIVLLHPIYTYVTDLDIVWVFKLAHPLLFSITPVALYRVYERVTDATTGFLGAYLYVSLFSFFVVLSRNTRTATALLFLSLLALLVVDDSLDHDHAKFLAILFALSIVVSHYGVAYMVLAALPAVWVLTRVYDAAFETETRQRTSVAFVGVYLSGAFAWYIYAAPNSKSFGTLVGFLNHFVTRLQSEFLSPSASATTRIIANNWQSSTLRVLKFYNVLVGGIIVVGLLLVLYRRYAGDDVLDADSEYLAYATVFLAVFSVTFLPVERFNTARTYPTTLVFFAPFFVLGIRESISLVRAYAPGGFDWVSARHVATVLLVVYFALNSGLVSATVTHEYSTNVLVEKPRVMHDGRPPEAEYFYKQYPTVYEGGASEWLVTTAPVNATVHQSNWPGNFGMPFGYERRYSSQHDVRLEGAPIPGDEPAGSGYVFLGPFSHLAGVVTFPADHFEFHAARTDEVESNWASKNRVYDNGGAVVYR